MDLTSLIAPSLIALLAYFAKKYVDRIELDINDIRKTLFKYSEDIRSIEQSSKEQLYSLTRLRDETGQTLLKVQEIKQILASQSDVNDNFKDEIRKQKEDFGKVLIILKKHLQK